jgi:hypothetical protein
MKYGKIIMPREDASLKVIIAALALIIVTRPAPGADQIHGANMDRLGDKVQEMRKEAGKSAASFVSAFLIFFRGHALTALTVKVSLESFGRVCRWFGC